jgi:hypothetical protein
VLADHPDLRQRLIAAIVPQALRSTVEHSLATLPTSTIPFVIGLIGLLFSGTGVVFSAYQALNHVAAVRHRFRAGFLSRHVTETVYRQELRPVLQGGAEVMDRLFGSVNGDPAERMTPRTATEYAAL